MIGKLNYNTSLLMIPVGYWMKYNQQNLVIYGEAHWTLIATKIVANMSELWNSIEWWSRRLLEDVRLVSETLMDELSETSLTSSKSLLSLSKTEESSQKQFFDFFLIVLGGLGAEGGPGRGPQNFLYPPKPKKIDSQAFFFWFSSKFSQKQKKVVRNSFLIG